MVSLYKYLIFYLVFFNLGFLSDCAVSVSLFTFTFSVRAIMSILAGECVHSMRNSPFVSGMCRSFNNHVSLVNYAKKEMHI